MEQVRVLSDELGTVKGELINLKAAHAALHQTSVESNARIERVAREAGETRSPDSGFSGKGKPLIKPENVVVEKFNGAITGDRAEFISWAESV